MSNFFAQGLKSRPIAVDNGFVSIPPEVRPARAPFSRGPVALRDGCAYALASTVVSVHVVETSDPAATEALGAQLAADLHEGDIVLVRGELGTGKTTLVRGAARALGVRDPVTSPSFSIGHRYRARGTYVSRVGGWSGRPDPHTTVVPHYTTGGANNWGKYTNKEVDDLLARANVELEPAKRKALYVQLNDILLDESFIMVLAGAPPTLVAHANVSGIEPSAHDGFYYHNVIVS